MLINQPKKTINQVAKDLDRHVSTIWRWAQRGVKGRKLPLLRIGGRAYVLVAELEKFLTVGRDPESAEADKLISTEKRSKIAEKKLDTIGI